MEASTEQFLTAAVTSGRFHDMAEQVARDQGYDEVDAAQLANLWEMETFDLLDLVVTL